MAQQIMELQETEKARETQRSLSKINPGLGRLGADQVRPTEYYVGLYSVNKRQMADSRLAFIVESCAYRSVSIPACAADQRYVKVMDIPHPVQFLEADPHNPGEVVLRTQVAEFVAMNIVNPDVLGTSLDNLPPQSALNRYSIAGNCDLIRQGVFFTRAAEGTPEFERALRQAEQRRDDFYRHELDGLMGMTEDQIRQVMNSPRGLDVRTAAAHFGEDIPGVRGRTPKATCPNCFEKIPQGAAFHKNELLGVICVIDWKRAVDAGVKTRADVPEGKRWWKTEHPRGASSGIEDQLEAMSKSELVEFGRTLDLELNLRETKEDLISAIRAAEV